MGKTAFAAVFEIGARLGTKIALEYECEFATHLTAAGHMKGDMYGFQKD